MAELIVVPPVFGMCMNIISDMRLKLHLFKRIISYKQKKIRINYILDDNKFKFVRQNYNYE